MPGVSIPTTSVSTSNNKTVRRSTKSLKSSVINEQLQKSTINKQQQINKIGKANSINQQEHIQPNTNNNKTTNIKQYKRSSSTHLSTIEQQQKQSMLMMDSKQQHMPAKVTRCYRNQLANNFLHYFFLFIATKRRQRIHPLFFHLSIVSWPNINAI